MAAGQDVMQHAVKVAATGRLDDGRVEGGCEHGPAGDVSDERRKRDDGRAGGLAAELADFQGGIEFVENRHLDVHEDGVIELNAKLHDRFVAVASRIHTTSHALQKRFQEFARCIGIPASNMREPRRQRRQASRRSGPAGVAVTAGFDRTHDTATTDVPQKRAAPHFPARQKSSPYG